MVGLYKHWRALQIIHIRCRALQRTPQGMYHPRTHNTTDKRIYSSTYSYCSKCACSRPTLLLRASNLVILISFSMPSLARAQHAKQGQNERKISTTRECDCLSCEYRLQMPDKHAWAVSEVMLNIVVAPSAMPSDFNLIVGIFWSANVNKPPHSAFASTYSHIALWMFALPLSVSLCIFAWIFAIVMHESTFLSPFWKYVIYVLYAIHSCITTFRTIPDHRRFSLQWMGWHRWNKMRSKLFNMQNYVWSIKRHSVIMLIQRSFNAVPNRPCAVHLARTAYGFSYGFEMLSFRKYFVYLLVVQSTWVSKAVSSSINTILDNRFKFLQRVRSLFKTV